MEAKRKVIISALAGGVILYIIDSFIYYYQVSASGESFAEILLMNAPVPELYSRLLLFVGILLFGFIVAGFIGNLVSENKFLRQQQEESTPVGMDADFISGLSYQIRTPLNAIVGFSELLKDPNLSMQSKQTYINHIHSSGSYLLQLLNNLTDISRIESKQLALDKNTTRIYELFEGMRKQFQEKIKEAGKDGVRLILNHGVEDPEYKILIDDGRFRQVLENLLENSLKYTEEGFIEFGYLIKNNNHLEVTIKDSGQGYTRERLEMILNRYRNLTDNQNQPFDVVALRLTISKNLIKVMGGEIHAESEIRKGSKFTLKVPFSEPTHELLEDQDEEHEDENPAEHRNWEKRTVLIAEDVESNFIYLQELLRPTGADLIWVKNGEEAIREVERNPEIDIVLMDILMPEMDGYEASQKLKELRSDLPLIAQTAYNLEGDRSAEAHIYFDDYLIKPLWAPQLLAAIEKHFNKR
jgi:signal transduction histidine kinase/CheY-like chemotaxis protein